MPIRILIADDEPIERKVLTKLIDDSHLPAHVVDTAGSGSEALRLFDEYLPDLLFMDIRMPGMSGLDVSAAIKIRQPDTAIAIVTAYDEFPYAKRAIDLHVDYFLLKPVEAKDVHRIVKEVLGRKDGPTLELAAAADNRNPSAARLQLAKATMHLLHKHYADPITLDWLEDRMNASQQYLGKTFRETYRMTIMSYLTQYRMKQATRLLSEPELSIAAVAERIGIPDASYFGHMFKNAYQLTPSQYRNRFFQQAHQIDPLS